jgi:hypothetical protein
MAKVVKDGREFKIGTNWMALEGWHGAVDLVLDRYETMHGLAFQLGLSWDDLDQLLVRGMFGVKLHGQDTVAWYGMAKDDRKRLDKSG